MNKNIKQFLVIFLAWLPIIIWMDYGMGISLFSDYGFLKYIIFVATVFFYGYVYKKYI